MKERATSFTVTPLSPTLGGRVDGLDLSRPLNDATFATLRQCWHEAGGLLVIADQRLTPEAHIAFSRRFGPLFGEAEQLQDTLAKYLLPGHLAIYRVSNKVVDGVPQGRLRAGTYWHSDVSFRERPAMASLLYAIEIPSVGGDTLFANMAAAHDALSRPMREVLEGVRAVHAFAVAAATQYDPRDVIAADLRGGNAHDHPVVRTHPETGRKCLYVNPGFTARLVGFSEAESAAILEFLYAHGTRPEFIYRHRWSARDLVIWDNRCLMHYAVADYEGLGDRHMHRTTVIGDRPQ